MSFTPLSYKIVVGTWWSNNYNLKGESIEDTPYPPYPPIGESIDVSFTDTEKEEELGISQEPSPKVKGPNKEPKNKLLHINLKRLSRVNSHTVQKKLQDILMQSKKESREISRTAKKKMGYKRKKSHVNGIRWFF